MCITKKDFYKETDFKTVMLFSSFSHVSFSWFHSLKFENFCPSWECGYVGECVFVSHEVLDLMISLFA